MMRHMLKSKIHRATVTDACLDYEGSISVDQELLNLADIYIGEKVQVLNLSNGERFETYTLLGEKNSGTMCVNGPAARLVLPGDLIIILTYGLYSEEEIQKHVPSVIHVDANNRVK
ncbi:aspartate 1-decarboxylase [PVC group bacterium (ex Bugula neritina AB1)]|nr:aspartate 1-decarboxylase [PVC group bacterium (ex Bugula neritina AB1)]